MPVIYRWANKPKVENKKSNKQTNKQQQQKTQVISFMSRYTDEDINDKLKTEQKGKAETAYKKQSCAEK